MSAPFLAVEGVHKTHRLGETEVPALRGVDLQLARGEFCALLGPSGSGKSTLLHLFGCLDQPDRGKVWLEGQDVVAMSEVERSRLRNRKIGFVFQSFNLLSVLSVFENVELPLTLQPELGRKERHDKVMQGLEDVGIAAQRDVAPDKLSGGQRQRVAIARALVTSPSLVLADEPSANLDTENTHKMIELMLELNQRRHVTFLFSTHDEKLISSVGRIVRIRDGLIQ